MQNEAAIMPELPRVSLRILCVEDEPELLDDLATELLDHGFAVDKAVDGPQGLELLAGSHFDLVICDMRLPGMTGLEMMREDWMRSRERPQPPFIFLTAFADEETRRHALAGGAAEFILKPVDYVQLIDTVEQLLKG
jgi:CheY-like chemotaxis protein